MGNREIPRKEIATQRGLVKPGDRFRHARTEVVCKMVDFRVLRLHLFGTSPALLLVTRAQGLELGESLPFRGLKCRHRTRVCLFSRSQAVFVAGSAPKEATKESRPKREELLKLRWSGWSIETLRLEHWLLQRALQTLESDGEILLQNGYDQAFDFLQSRRQLGILRVGLALAHHHMLVLTLSLLTASLGFPPPLLCSESALRSLPFQR